MSRKWIALIGFIVLVAIAASFGSMFPPGPWYDGLQKPSWNPPSWLFGPVWTVLYLMIAVAGWMIWRIDDPRRQTALGCWGFQLVLNGLWSWLFFGLYRPDLAFANISLMWLAIVATIIAFWRLRPLAGALLIPYLCWVSFAAALNYTIWQLN